MPEKVQNSVPRFIFKINYIMKASLKWHASYSKKFSRFRPWTQYGSLLYSLPAIWNTMIAILNQLRMRTAKKLLMACRRFPKQEDESKHELGPKFRCISNLLSRWADTVDIMKNPINCLLNETHVYYCFTKLIKTKETNCLFEIFSSQNRENGYDFFCIFAVLRSSISLYS